LRGKLVEINSHSLFSKWFSESGKLVQKLFSQVTEMVEDERCFVVVMIGEPSSVLLIIFPSAPQRGNSELYAVACVRSYKRES
jgi:hypothetical protein